MLAVNNTTTKLDCRAGRKNSRILARRAEKGGLADGALDVEGLFVRLELRLGRTGLVLGVAFTLLRSLGTLLLKRKS